MLYKYQVGGIIQAVPVSEQKKDAVWLCQRRNWFASDIHDWLGQVSHVHDLNFIFWQGLLVIQTGMVKLIEPTSVGSMIKEGKTQFESNRIGMMISLQAKVMPEGSFQQSKKLASKCFSAKPVDPVTWYHCHSSRPKQVQRSKVFSNLYNTRKMDLCLLGTVQSTKMARALRKGRYWTKHRRKESQTSLCVQKKIILHSFLSLEMLKELLRRSQTTTNSRT